MSGRRTSLVPSVLVAAGPALTVAAWLFLPDAAIAARLALEALGALLLGLGLIGLCRD